MLRFFVTFNDESEYICQNQTKIKNMKKSILAVAVVLGATSTFAQDLTSKKGENYLPEAGDWAIGIDAVPLLDYVGNFFGKTGPNNNAGNIWTPSNPNLVITGKYFVEDDLAYRGGIRLGFGSTKNTVTVADRQVAAPATNPWPENAAEVENTRKIGSTNVGLTFGLEKRKGSTRLQGFYGAELGFLITSSSEKYTYGNALTAGTATIPVTVTGDDNFGGNTFGVTDGQGNGVNARYLEVKNGLGFSLGLRAFIGAEYFIIPKLSIGGEFGWGLALNISGKSSSTAETVGLVDGATDSSVQTISSEGNKTTSFGLDNSIVNPLFGPVGRLNLTFHF
jgi:hypothetical protein